MVLKAILFGLAAIVVVGFIITGILCSIFGFGKELVKATEK